MMRQNQGSITESMAQSENYDKYIFCRILTMKCDTVDIYTNAKSLMILFDAVVGLCRSSLRPNDPYNALIVWGVRECIGAGFGLTYGTCGIRVKLQIR